MKSLTFVLAVFLSASAHAALSPKIVTVNTTFNTVKARMYVIHNEQNEITGIRYVHEKRGTSNFTNAALSSADGVCVMYKLMSETCVISLKGALSADKQGMDLTINYYKPDETKGSAKFRIVYNASLSQFELRDSKNSLVKTATAVVHTNWIGYPTGIDRVASTSVDTP